MNHSHHLKSTSPSPRSPSTDHNPTRKLNHHLAKPPSAHTTTPQTPRNLESPQADGNGPSSEAKSRFLPPEEAVAKAVAIDGDVTTTEFIGVAEEAGGTDADADADADAGGVKERPDIVFRTEFTCEAIASAMENTCDV
ncbi:hypothetical protein LTR64_002248 [Lithohypha guttulata]|uniref:uncharacterized protein n=1 Tax=Lithohypha guttulata TaxID=1690604 RepID=UPI002DDF58C5|nr:hypothetical protein LTR51_001526 [Lithohypha guttulata]